VSCCRKRRLILPFFAARTGQASLLVWPCLSVEEGAMRDLPESLRLDEYPAYLLQDTDTAHPRTPIPIYYIHSLGSPFCAHPSCTCRRNVRDVTRLLGNITKGTLLLQNVAPLLEERREEAMRHTTGTEQPTVHRVDITLVEGVPLLCQLYGHTFEATERPGVKVCHLCGVKGYCSGCTPRAPQGAQVFNCTAHTRLPGW
jgi:hypothetical protein